MTVRKTEWLPDGSCLEYESNAGAEPKITLNGKPITYDHYVQITGRSECCNHDCRQGRDCPVTRQSKNPLVTFIKGLFK